MEALTHDGYIGKVNLKILHGGVLIREIESHNAGTVELFKYISDCLSGATSSNLEPLRKPGMLKLFLAHQDLTTDEVRAAYSDLKSTRTVNSSSNPYAYYSLQFTIPATQLNAGTKFRQLHLYNLGGNIEYATIDLDEVIEIVNNNTSLIVEWKLGFMNK